MFERVDRWLSQWDQDNIPEKYYPYKDDNDFVYVLGHCFGVVIIPRGENDSALMYLRLEEDDCYYCVGEYNSYKHNFHIEDEIKCLQVAKEYIEAHATKVNGYYCLPWK